MSAEQQMNRNKIPPPKPPRLYKGYNKSQQQTVTNATDVEFFEISETTKTNKLLLQTKPVKKTFHKKLYKKNYKKKKNLHFNTPLTNNKPILPTNLTTYVTESQTVTRATKMLPDDADQCAILADVTSAAEAATAAIKSKVAKTRKSATSTITTAKVAAMSTSRAAAPAAANGKRKPSKSKRRLAHGCTALMHACQRGDIVEVLELMRSKPEQLHQRDSRNKSVLHYCAVQYAQTRDLVAAASIAIAAPELLGSADEDGFTPLHLAVIQGNLAMVNLLVANKADLNAVDNEGHSAVHWATVCGEVEALRALLAAGANVTTPDINGGTPLHYAAQMCGASYDNKLGQTTSHKLSLDILDILLAHPQCSVDVQDKDGRQPLLWASSAGSAKAVIALVKAGARVESADKDGLTALHCAASRGHTECIDTLISLCGAPTDLIDSNGCTSLHYAVTLGHADATSRLLDLEADPNRQDRKGRTPAHCGCSKGQFETVKLLKERGANLWLRNAKGDLPVHEAASSGRRELVEWLLQQRLKHVNTTSNDGRSLLHIAASNDFTDMCKMLLDFGGDINAVYRNTKGIVFTPLDCALQKGNRSTAKFLQSNGGLPAGKLRLAAKRTNPFPEFSANIVRPLKYTEKEEIHDLENSKKYVVYLKRSESDANDEENCSCTEQTYRKEQRFEHTCRRHQRSRRHHLRRRTSSCGEPKEICCKKNCGDICRSKSNIEIRRRKSRERCTSSSDRDENEDEDSCENCCYHKREKQRVIHRHKYTSLRRNSKHYKDADDEYHIKSERDSSPDKRQKRAVEDSGNKIGQINQVEQSNEVVTPSVQPSMPASVPPSVPTSRPASKTSLRSRPQSATRRQTPPTSAGKAGGSRVSSATGKQQMVVTSASRDGTFIKSPPETPKKIIEEEEDTMTAQQTVAVGEFTDEDDVSKTGDLMTTEVEVHRDADNGSITTLEAVNTIENEPEQQVVTETTVEDKSDETAETADKMSQNAVDESLAAELATTVEKALETVAKEIETVEGIIEATTSAVVPKELDDEETNKTTEVTNDVEVENEKSNEGDAITLQTLTAPDLIETPATPIPTPIVTPVASPKEQTSPSTVEKAEITQQPISAVTSPIASSQPTDVPDVATLPDVADTSNVTETKPTATTDLPKSPTKADTPPPTFMKDTNEEVALGNTQGFRVMTGVKPFKSLTDAEQSDGDKMTAQENGEEDEDEGADSGSPMRRFVSAGGSRRGIGTGDSGVTMTPIHEVNNGRKRRLKRRIKSGSKTRGNNWKMSHDTPASGTKDQDSGFEPSPRALRTKIPTPSNMYTAYVRRRPAYTMLDGRMCASRLENRKPGDKNACDMSAVTRSIQRNIRRYYMERKIFQHLLELKSLQIRSNKSNEAVLVKRAVDDYHKSCAALGGETGTRLRRYVFSEYTFKNFEIFLYETLKSLQKPGTYNFRNINEVYAEAERRLSPDFNAYEKALRCTVKTHRCLHAAHAYTGIPCAAYIPMMNHHTIPKVGFGSYKNTGVGSFYLPKILMTGTGCGGKVALELSHGKSKQLISLPSEKLDSNKRYYVTFTVKGAAGDRGSCGKTNAVAGDAATTTTGVKPQNVSGK